MKKYFECFIVVILCLSLQSIYAQNPFKQLEKSEKLYKKGQYNKALKKIVRAENSDYCSCGNCVIELNWQANLLRYKIYNKLGKHSESRQALDSIYFISNKTDSLKFITYQMEYGKGFISENIDLSLSKIKISYGKKKECYIDIPLGSEEKSMRFKVGYEYSIVENNEEKIKLFLKSSIYKMIKNNQ
jgi:hypothetical protein